MNKSKKQSTVLRALITTFLLSFFAVELQAETQVETKGLALDSHKKQLCESKGVNLASQQCADLIKQSQLGTVKLSPQVRVSDIKKDHDINLAELYPFTGGSAGASIR